MDGYEQKLVADLDYHEELLLHQLDVLRNRLFVFVMETRSVRHPTVDEVPWPVLLTLCGLSRKHIVISGKLPDLWGVTKELREAKYRLTSKMKRLNGGVWDAIQTAYADDLHEKLVDRVHQAISSRKGKLKDFKNEQLSKFKRIISI